MTIIELFNNFPLSNTTLQNAREYRKSIGLKIKMICTIIDIIPSVPSNTGFIRVKIQYNSTKKYPFVIYDENITPEIINYSGGDFVEMNLEIIPPIEPFEFNDSELCMKLLSVKKISV